MSYDVQAALLVLDDEVAQMTENAIEELSKENSLRELADEIAMRIAQYVPNERMGDRLQCKHCLESWGFPNRDDRLIPENHMEDCLWRLAKLCVARTGG